MAIIKITLLPAEATPGTLDLLAIVNDPAGSPETKKATLADIWNAGSIGGLNIVNDTTPELGGNLDGLGLDLLNMGVLFVTEQAAPETPIAGKGQFFARTGGFGMFVDPAGIQTAVNRIEENVQTGTTYLTVLSDANKLISMNNAGANVLTIDSNANVAYPVGTSIMIEMRGAGITTIAIATDTLNSFSTFVNLAGQYAIAVAHKTAVTRWVLSGNLVA